MSRLRREQVLIVRIIVNNSGYRKIKISRNDHARAYIDKIKHTNKGFHFFVSERRIFEGQPINRAILTHPETIVIQHNISDTTPRKRKYLEQLLQDLRNQYPEAKEVEGAEEIQITIFKVCDKDISLNEYLDKIKNIENKFFKDKSEEEKISILRTITMIAIGIY